MVGVYLIYCQCINHLGQIHFYLLRKFICRILHFFSQIRLRRVSVNMYGKGNLISLCSL